MSDDQEDTAHQGKEAAVTQKRVPAIVFKTEAGGEPLRDWLKSLSVEDRKLIGADITTVEFG